EEAFVTLEIYNLLGQKIRTLFEGPQNAGSHSVPWDGKNDSGESVASGIYIIRLTADAPSTRSGQGFVQSRKIAFVK
ncbi:MAG: FlgD immunoglobulin-like domain containing protein, partial [bacterium]